MADIVLSNELYIVYDGTQIACTTDFTLNLEKAQIDINCGSGWSGNLGGAKNWSLDFSAIVKRTDTNLIYSDLLTQFIISDIEVLVALKSNILTDNYYQGNAIITNLTQTGTIDDAVKYSGTLTGTGQLYIITGTPSENDGFEYLLEMEIIG